MTTLSQEPSVVLRRPAWLYARDLWAASTIAMMWLAMLFDGIFGPDFHTADAAGNSTTIPSAIGVALFASIGTWAVAKYGFGRTRTDS